MAHHPQANTTSNFDPGHYPEALARVAPEADDAGYVKPHSRNYHQTKYSPKPALELARSGRSKTRRPTLPSNHITPELSRPTAGRRLSANIAESVHLGAALMWARLE